MQSLPPSLSPPALPKWVTAYPTTGKIPQRRRDSIRQALSWWAIREGLRGLQRRGIKTLSPWLCHSPSPQSFCKSVLVSWLLCSPWLTQPGNYAKDLVLDQRAPQRKSGQGKNVCCFPWDLLCPVAVKQTLEQKPTLTRDNSCVFSTIIYKWCQSMPSTGWGDFRAYCVCLCELNSIKTQGRRYSGPFSFEVLVTFPPQANLALSIFIFHPGWPWEFYWWRPPSVFPDILCLEMYPFIQVV